MGAGSVGGSTFASPHALTAFLACAALPPEVDVCVPSLGHVTISVQDRQIRPEQVLNLELGCEGIDLSAAGTRAVLWVEKGLARVVVDAILHRGEGLVWQPLSRIERGLLQGAAAAFASFLGVPPVLQLAEPDTERVTPIALVVRVRIFSLEGRAWLCMSQGFARWLLRERAGDTTLKIELGSTKVPRSEWSSAQPGDAVVFDAQSPLVDAEAWTVRLRAGGRSASAQWFADGRLEVLQLSPRMPETRVERTSATGNDMPREMIEITAEAARPVATVVAGFTPRPAPLRTAMVTLVAQGRTWAEGSIVTVDGCLAVQLTKLLASS